MVGVEALTAFVLGAMTCALVFNWGRRRHLRGRFANVLLLEAVLVLAFGGLAYSFYPYVVPEQMTIYQAAAAPEALIIILVGALIVLPVIIAYSVLAYTVFRGKATELTYS